MLEGWHFFFVQAGNALGMALPSCSPASSSDISSLWGEHFSSNGGRKRWQKEVGKKNTQTFLNSVFMLAIQTGTVEKGRLFCISHEYKMYFSINFSLPTDFHYA